MPPRRIEPFFHLTFEQDLELLVARWSDQNRKNREALSVREIAVGLALKAKQLVNESDQSR